METWQFIATFISSLLLGGGGVGIISYYLQKRRLDADIVAEREKMRGDREKMLIEARDVAQSQVVEAWANLANEQAERITALHADSDKLQGIISNLREKVEVLSRELEEMRTEVAVLSREVRHRDDRIIELERIEKKQADQIRNLRYEIRALNEENTILKRQRDALELRVCELEELIKGNAGAVAGGDSV